LPSSTLPLTVALPNSFHRAVRSHTLDFLDLFPYYVGVPRHLHSFPTRRSSDLARGGRSGRRARRLPGRAADRRRHRRRPADPRADRKSTRLNSSHQIISYAVFCLKKKRLACFQSVATTSNV